MKEQDRTHIDKTGPKEIAWFVALWALGVVAVAITGFLIKLVI